MGDPDDWMVPFEKALNLVTLPIRGLSERVCSRCVLDTTAPLITFDKRGVCNYCHQHEQFEREYPIGQGHLERLAERIKKEGEGNEFDCVIGVSGGCDSSYLCLLAKELGLRPLAVHFDNTYNSRVAVENMHRVLKHCDIPLYTKVMETEDMGRMINDFMLSGVPELDAISDVALTTVAYMACEEHGIKHILNGHSFRTEGMTPPGWFYFDGKYIESICKPIPKSYPNLWLDDWLRWLEMGIERHRPLYYIDYRKEDAKAKLEKIGWKWYGGHHMENRFTTFCDNYWLPIKYGIDLRKVEFSALIRSGQMARENALKELEGLPECGEAIVDEIKRRVELTEIDFQERLARPIKSHKNFVTYLPEFREREEFFKRMYEMNRVPKSFYVKYCGGE